MDDYGGFWVDDGDFRLEDGWGDGEGYGWGSGDGWGGGNGWGFGSSSFEGSEDPFDHIEG